MRCWLFFNRDLAPDVPEAHEVLRFAEAAKALDIELLVLKPAEFDLVVDSNHSWSAIYQGRELPKPDLIIPRTGSETSYFTLAVLRHFERMGVAIVNPPAAVEAVADKLHTLQVLAGAKIPIPKTILGKFPADVALVEREIGFPVVVKKLRGTRGAGVMLAENRAQFDDLANLLDGVAPGQDFLFQQYIKASHGRDVRLLVIDSKVVAAMERRSTDGGFKSNISLGGSGQPFAAPPEMVKLAANARANCSSTWPASTSCLTLTAIASARPIRRPVSKVWSAPAVLTCRSWCSGRWPGSSACRCATRSVGSARSNARRRRCSAASRRP